jgi:uncharacterized RDD family membrane protein YckC
MADQFHMEFRLAGFWIRLPALFLDGVILAIPNNVFQFIGKRLFEMISGYPVPQGSGAAMLLTLFMNFYVGFLYFGFVQYLMQGTPGKRLVGIRVISADGGTVPFGRMAVRYLMTWVSGTAAWIGYLWAVFDPKKRTWHDLVAKTLVVYKREMTKIETPPASSREFDSAA